MTKYLGSYPDLGSGGARMLHPRAQGEVFLGLQITTPSNPPSGYDALYFKSDGNLYRLTPAGTETKITLSGGIVNADVDSAAAIAMTKLQPNEFLAYASTQSNVTGDGTVYTVVFANEIIDGNGRFDSTSTFTASGSGLYLFEIVLFIEGVTAAMTDADVKLVTSNRTYNFNFNPNALKTLSNRFTFATSIHADMDNNDTAFVQISITGGTKVADIDGGDVRSHFAGHFIG